MCSLILQGYGVCECEHRRAQNRGFLQVESLRNQHDEVAIILAATAMAIRRDLVLEFACGYFRLPILNVVDIVNCRQVNGEALILSVPEGASYDTTAGTDPQYTYVCAFLRTVRPRHGRSIHVSPSKPHFFGYVQHSAPCSLDE